MKHKIVLFLFCVSIQIFAVKDLFEKGKKEVEKTVKKGVKKTKQTAKKVEKGTKATAQKTQKGVKTAAKETGKAVEKAGKAVKEEVIDPLAGSLEKLDKWKLPKSSLRFDQVTYLGAHNAHANVQEGYAYHQQLWSLDNQLKNGVRHFLLDTWIAKEGPNKGKVTLCHGDCEKMTRAQRLGSKKQVLFKTYLQKMKQFLDKHPKEILSIELENVAGQSEVNKVIDQVSGLKKYILTPADYDPKKHDGKWPTLNWMIQNNKRLVIFDTGDPSQYGFSTNGYMVRNMYGTLDVDKACKIRKKPKGARLFQMNYFGTATSPAPIHNTPKQLKKVLSTCQKKGVVSSGQQPNFIALDNVHLGNPMNFVNELNQKAAKK